MWPHQSRTTLRRGAGQLARDHAAGGGSRLRSEWLGSIHSPLNAETPSTTGALGAPGFSSASLALWFGSWDSGAYPPRLLVSTSNSYDS